MSGDEDDTDLRPTDDGNTPSHGAEPAASDSTGPGPTDPDGHRDPGTTDSGPDRDATAPAPADPPEPGGAASLVELAEAVRTLWEWAGRPSEEALRGGGEDLPPGTVAAVLGGQVGSWQDAEPFVAACLRYGQRSAEQVSFGLMAWRDAWNAFDPTVRHLSVQRPVGGPDTVGPLTPAWPQDAVPPMEPAPPVDIPLGPPAGEARSRRRISVVTGAAAVVAVLVVVGGAVALASTSPLHGTAHPQSDPATTSQDTAVASPGLSVPLPNVSATTGRPSPTGSPTGASASPTVADTGGPRPTDPGTHPATRPPTTVPAPPPPPPATKPPASSPAPPSYPTVYTSGGAGKAYFVALGEHLFVCDLVPDGYGVVAQYTRTDVPGQNNEAKDGNGSGSCVDHNMNMPEGAKITFRVCLISKSGALSRCSGRITAVA